MGGTAVAKFVIAMLARLVCGVVLASPSLACTALPVVRVPPAPAASDRAAACGSPPLDPKPSAASDGSALASPVGQLRVEGLRQVPAEFVRLLMTKTPGGPLEPNELEGAERRLLALGAFDSVRFRTEAPDATLVVDVVERPRVSRVFFVGNATQTAIRGGLAPQRGDIFDRDVLVKTAHDVERTWAELGETLPRVTIHARHLAPDSVDLCVRASALDPYRVDRAVDAMERLYRESLNEAAPTRAYVGPALTDYVNALSARVANSIGPDAAGTTVTITDTTDPHADANPRAKSITISRALIGMLGSEAQLAAVVGHELGHIVLRHGITDDVTRAVGEGPGAFRDADWEAYRQMQADRVAIDAVERLGYDPREALVALGTLLDFTFEQRATLRMANDLISRLARTRLLLHARQGGRDDRATYLEHLDGLPWGAIRDETKPMRIRIRPAAKAGSLSDVLDATCPAKSTELDLVNPNHDPAATIAPGTPLKCLLSE